MTSGERKKLIDQCLGLALYELKLDKECTGFMIREWKEMGRSEIYWFSPSERIDAYRKYQELLRPLPVYGVDVLTAWLEQIAKDLEE